MLLVPLVACEATSDTLDGATVSTSATQAATTGSVASTGAGFQTGASSGAGGAPACVATSVPSELERMPIDLIVAVDTSSSMNAASNAVEQNINENLAQILESSGLDYRVIVIAGYGSGINLCIGPPLGGADCASPPPMPANTERFKHYVVNGLGSGSILQAIFNFYSAADNSGEAPSGYQDWLRPDSQKVFLLFSDTGSSPNATSVGDTFDANLLAIPGSPFGTPQARNYTFHSIIGMRQSTPATAPWLATDPIVGGVCSGGGIDDDDLGAGGCVQQVSILSGGLRFPICQHGAFDVVFQRIADSVLQRAVVACDIPFPEAPAGESIDPNTLTVTLTPSGGGQPVKMHQVADAQACVADAFFVEDEIIHLCEAACDAVQEDVTAKVDVSFGCDVGFVP